MHNFGIYCVGVTYLIGIIVVLICIYNSYKAIDDSGDFTTDYYILKCKYYSDNAIIDSNGNIHYIANLYKTVNVKISNLCDAPICALCNSDTGKICDVSFIDYDFYCQHYKNLSKSDPNIIKYYVDDNELFHIVLNYE